ncbi:MAG: phospholipase D-like domain-containing protein [Archaeoglobaceae archaeon]
MKKIWLILISLIIILGLTGSCSAEDTTVSIEANYKFISTDEVKDTFTLKFKNTADNSTRLSMSVPMRTFVEDPRVTDKPAGYVNSTFRDMNGTKVLFLNIDKVLSPYEEYTVTIEGEVSGVTDRVGENSYRFYAVEYPEYFTSLDLPVDEIQMSIDFPQNFFTAYKITSVSSNSQISYTPYNSVEEISWNFINPKNQVVAIVEFEKMLNFMTLNILGGFLIVGAFIALFVMSHRSEEKYKKMKILIGTPWGGDIVAKLREVLRNAKHEVLIASPHIYYTDWLTAELKPLIAEGVKVRIVTWPSYERRNFRHVEDVIEDRKQLFTLRRFLEMFEPGTVRINDNIHAKLVVVDESKVLVTTANFTQTGLWENYESGYWAENEELAKQAKEFFEIVWNAKETLELDESTINPKISWAQIMDLKSEDSE